MMSNAPAAATPQQPEGRRLREIDYRVEEVRGYLHKFSGNKWQKKWFQTEDQALAVYRDERETRKDIPQRANNFSLPKVEEIVLLPEDHEYGSKVFAIKRKDQRDAFMGAKSREDAAYWVETLLWRAQHAPGVAAAFVQVQERADDHTPLPAAMPAGTEPPEPPTAPVDEVLEPPCFSTRPLGHGATAAVADFTQSDEVTEIMLLLRRSSWGWWVLVAALLASWLFSK